MNAPPIRLLVVDDHPLLRLGISSIIEGQSDMSLVGEASNGAEALEQFRALKPDVTLMDLQMPQMNGVDAIRLIRTEFGQARIIVLTTYAGDAQAMRALKAGAVGYLLKSAVRKELIDRPLNTCWPPAYTCRHRPGNRFPQHRQRAYGPRSKRSRMRSGWQVKQRDRASA